MSTRLSTVSRMSFRQTAFLFVACALLFAGRPGTSTALANQPTFHWVATWGTPAAPGQLSRPAGIALDSAGNVSTGSTQMSTSPMLATTVSRSSRRPAVSCGPSAGWAAAIVSSTL